MPDVNKADLLAAWLEGTLSDSQRHAFERLCVEDKEFEQQVANANHWVMKADTFTPEAVPQWAMDNTFEAPVKRRWWQWQLLPAVSTAMSAAAMVMVISGFQVSVKDGAVTLRFGAPDTAQQVENLVQQRLNDFQQSQQASMTSFAQALQQQQLDASTQLTNYLLSSSREERREDFAELIKFINEQRSDDQQFYARQLSKLERELRQNDNMDSWNDPAQSIQ